ncbi:hypothetical protein JVU11DRAFT_7762 [Chiua virens]|nr:hypothetical protein JVU11DRAFT_7762 [Chiua virens]
MLECFTVSDECRTRPTLQSLISLSRYCPHLRSVGISLGSSYHSSMSIGPSFLRPTLERLHLELIGSSMVHDPAGIGTFILDLFHGLTVGLRFDSDNRNLLGGKSWYRILGSDRVEDVWWVWD